MFIWSVRASSLKFFGAVLLGVALLMTVTALLPDEEASTAGLTEETVNYENVYTAEDGAAFLSQFGWTVSSTPTETVEMTIPSEFDRVFLGYNRIQLEQGLDLSRYRKKAVTRYTYEVQNYEGYNGTVLASVIVYRGTVIGGDLCGEGENGFVHGFSKL